jgi:hypothetical protein
MPKIDRPSGPTQPLDGIAEPDRAGEPQAAFTEALGKSEGATGVEAVAPAGIEELVGRFRAGEIDMDALLDSLVEGAARGAPLGERGRMELREMLRAAVENDPTLRRLAREIEQG